jgi:hypothetical protein
VIYS